MKPILVFLLIFKLAFQLIAIEPANENPTIQSWNSISIEASYIGDFVGNISGGLSKGTSYLGLANFQTDFNTELFGIWKGGNLFLNVGFAHGKSPSENLIGDFQIASNIDAGGNFFFIQELWFNQKIKNLSIKLGLLDLNADFASSENSSHFINSSFGIAPVIANNVPSSIFPFTGLGITGEYVLDTKIKIQLGIFDGCPAIIGSSDRNFCWKIKDTDGLLFFTEIQFLKKINEQTGIYKLGYYYHTGLSEKNETNNEYYSVFKHNYGYYLNIDQVLWKNKNHSLGLFSQISYSPPEINEHNFYGSFGLNINGCFLKSGNDSFGLAFAFAGFNYIKNHKHESVMELYYHLKITDNFYIRPDIQIVLNPEGTEMELSNAFVSFLRFGLNI